MLFSAQISAVSLEYSIILVLYCIYSVYLQHPFIVIVFILLSFSADMLTLLHQTLLSRSLGIDIKVYVGGHWNWYFRWGNFFLQEGPENSLYKKQRIRILNKTNKKKRNDFDCTFYNLSLLVSFWQSLFASLFAMVYTPFPTLRNIFFVGAKKFCCNFVVRGCKNSKFFGELMYWRNLIFINDQSYKLKNS